jgi:hypothetical protein
VTREAVAGLALAALIVANAAAQIGGKPVAGGNPTPGTPQPDPPNLEDRITLTGCVEIVNTSPALDSNTVSEERFKLSGAPTTYRLAAIESQLSPFVGTKVEISGEVLKRPVPTIQVEFVQKLAPKCS